VNAKKIITKLNLTEIKYLEFQRKASNNFGVEQEKKLAFSDSHFCLYHHHKSNVYDLVKLYIKFNVAKEKIKAENICMCVMITILS
jgi:hypothetical protein